MTPERWQQIDRILQAALELAPEYRSAFLDKACAGDESLRREVEGFIDSDERAGSFIESTAMTASARALASGGPETMTGKSLGHYRILQQLGAGGMGEVYVAIDTRTERKVALKLLPPLFTQDEQRVQRFQQEARTVLGLNHPNIVTIYEIGKEGETHFIASELVEGETLRQRLVSSESKLSESLEVAIQAAAALTSAHEAGVVHRDIKPENIMIRHDGYVKVLDFGLAKLVEQTASSESAVFDASTQVLIKTDPGLIMGTAVYMSPEQARGLAVDVRTDIWSLGVVLYEIVAGRRPFSGETNSDVLVSILGKEPPPIARYAPGAPDELQWIIRKALRKDRDERYQTMKELVSDLRGLKQHLEVAAHLEQSAPAPVAGLQTRRTDSELVTPQTGAGTSSTADVAPQRTISSAEYLITEAKRHKGFLFGLAMIVLVVTAVVGVVLFKLKWQDKPIPFASIQIARVTTAGKATIAAISPDGKYVVHVLGGAGQQSLALRHIATGSDKEIVPSNGSDFSSVDFSPDGGHIYYVREEGGHYPLYRVPVLGGAPKNIIVLDVDTQVTFSPDRQRIAFMRGENQKGEVSLVVAGADGTGEQKLVTHKLSEFSRTGWPSPSWSPDGEKIAFAHRTPEADAQNVNVVTVRVKDGVEKQISSQKWSAIGALAWLADGSGLIITAADQEPGSAQQLWHVSYPSGAVRRITNDANNYLGLSLTADSSALVTVQREQASSVWTVPNGEANRAAQLTSSRSEGLNGVVWAPDGRIVYTVGRAGQRDIWIMNADGTNQRQLTADAGANGAPSVSADGRYIVFISTRAGARNIWRMDIDGSHPKQLTTGSDDQGPNCSPDGRWVVYGTTESDKQRVGKVAIDGGGAEQVTNYTSARPLVSPDGKMIVCAYVNEQESPARWRLATISFAGGPPIKTFDISGFQSRYQWAADGQALLYSVTRNGITNIWSQPLAGGPPKQLTEFNSDQIFRFDWSRDGRQLVLARGSVVSDVVLISGK